MVLSTLVFAMMSTMVKYLSQFGTFQLVFFRSLITLMFTLGFLLVNKIPLLGHQRKLLFYRGISGATSMILFFSALHFMAIGTAVTLRYTAPLFVALLSVWVLKEKIKGIQWFFFLLAFGGVVTIKGFDANVSLLGFWIIILSSITSAITYMLISKIGTRDHHMVIINYFMFIATVAGAIGCLFDWQTPQGMEWLQLISLGVLGFIAQILMTQAFQIGPAYKIAPYKYVEVIFSLAFGLLVFYDQYSHYSLIGMVMIVTGLVLNALYKAKRS